MVKKLINYTILWARFIFGHVVAGLVAAVVAGVILWLSGKQDLVLYTNVCAGIGMLAWIVGFFSIWANWQTRTKTQHARSVSTNNLPERTKQDMSDILGVYTFFIRCVLFGTTLMIVALGVVVWLD